MRPREWKMAEQFDQKREVLIVRIGKKGRLPVTI
jgi:hypothetical protein